MGAAAPAPALAPEDTTSSGRATLPRRPAMLPHHRFISYNVLAPGLSAPE